MGRGVEGVEYRGSLIFFFYATHRPENPHVWRGPRLGIEGAIMQGSTARLTGVATRGWSRIGGSVSLRCDYGAPAVLLWYVWEKVLDA